MTDSDLGRYVAGIGTGDITADPGRVLNQVGRLAGACPEHTDTTSAEQADLALALAVVLQCQAKHGPSDHSVAVQSLVLGKLGNFDEAVDVTQRAYGGRRTWNSATAYANALRRAGDIEGCVKLMWEASELDPTDVSALLDVGDIHLNNGAWSEALRAYALALAREPGHPWAEPSALYCRFRSASDLQALEALRGVAARPPDECGVEAALVQITGGYARDEARERAAFLLSLL